MDAASKRTTTPETELRAYASHGRRLTLHPPVLGTTCDRCGGGADDVCFLVEAPDGTTMSGGLCADCLLPLLTGPPGRGSAR